METHLNSEASNQLSLYLVEYPEFLQEFMFLLFNVACKLQWHFPYGDIQLDSPVPNGRSELNR